MGVIPAAPSGIAATDSADAGFRETMTFRKIR
jgi:hypothetical protein